MVQKNITLTSTAQLVAVGPGNAMFEGRDTAVSYWIGGIVSVPSCAAFSVEKNHREPMALADGEGLWMAGNGFSVVYAQVEPN